MLFGLTTSSITRCKKDVFEVHWCLDVINGILKRLRRDPDATIYRPDECGGRHPPPSTVSPGQRRRFMASMQLGGIADRVRSDHQAFLEGRRHAGSTRTVSARTVAAAES